MNIIIKVISGKYVNTDGKYSDIIIAPALTKSKELKYIFIDNIEFEDYLMLNIFNNKDVNRIKRFSDVNPTFLNVGYFVVLDSSVYTKHKEMIEFFNNGASSDKIISNSLEIMFFHFVNGVSILLKTKIELFIFYLHF